MAIETLGANPRVKLAVLVHLLDGTEQLKGICDQRLEEELW